MKSFLVTIFVLLSHQQVFCSTTDKQKLLADLLKNYNKNVEPDSTPLKFGLTYLCADLNPNTLELLSKTWEQYSWTDNRLVWDPTEYGGVAKLNIPSSIVWTPDMKLYNAPWEAEKRDDVIVVVQSDGSVIWIPPVSYRTLCQQPAEDEADDNIAAQCVLTIGSWTYDADALRLEAQSTEPDLSYYLTACPYVISESHLAVESKVYPCCPEHYASINITMKLTKRN